MKLNNYIYSNIKLEGNTNTYIRNSTKFMYDLISSNSKLKAKISPTKIKKGMFYLMKYKYKSINYNISIFVLDFKIVNNKPIIYVLNLSYLPYLYKTELFSSIFEAYNTNIEYNESVNDVLKEKSLEKLTSFEYIFNILKDNGNYTFAIETYTLENIIEITNISTTLAYRFLFMSSVFLNMKTITKIGNYISNKDKINEYNKLLKELYELIELDSDQSIEYHKRLKSYEKLLKRF